MEIHSGPHLHGVILNVLNSAFEATIRGSPATVVRRWRPLHARTWFRHAPPSHDVGGIGHVQACDELAQRAQVLVGEQQVLARGLHVAEGPQQAAPTVSGAPPPSWCAVDVTSTLVSQACMPARQMRAWSCRLIGS